MPSRRMAGASFIICPTFSARVIRPTRSWTRAGIGSVGSRYGTGDGVPGARDEVIWPATPEVFRQAEGPRAASAVPAATATAAERATATARSTPELLQRDGGLGVNL